MAVKHNKKTNISTRTKDKGTRGGRMGMRREAEWSKLNSSRRLGRTRISMEKRIKKNKNNNNNNNSNINNDNINNDKK